MPGSIPHRPVGSHSVSNRVEIIAGAGSEFRWTERLDLPLGAAGRWGWRLARPLAQRGMDLSVRRFARFVAAGAPR
jgi:hypothetical protein